MSKMLLFIKKGKKKEQDRTDSSFSGKNGFVFKKGTI